MKIITIFICFILMSNLCLSQESSNDNPCKKIGITFSSFGSNDVVRFQELDGAASYDSDHFFTIGFNYIQPINNSLFIETGIEYSKHTVLVNPNLPPNMDSEAYKSDFSIINIPITVRANFLKYLFINGGLIVDIDASSESVIDSQTGIGGLIGIGASYDFNFGASVFVNPYFKAHSLLPFSGEDYPHRLMESGIRIGVTYNLMHK